MALSAVGAIGTGSVTSVYATLSPYLNGVVRTSDAAQAAQVDAAANATNVAATASAIAARGDASADATAAPPFVNPAIAAIGARIALGESLTPPAAVTPDALLGSSSLIGTSTTATSPLAQSTQNDSILGTRAKLSNPFAVNPLVSTASNTLTTNVIDATTTTTALNAPQTASASAFAQVAYGDAGELIQSYGAVALATGPQALAASAFAQPVTPIIPPAAIVSPVAATATVA